MPSHARTAIDVFRLIVLIQIELRGWLPSPRRGRGLLPLALGLLLLPEAKHLVIGLAASIEQPFTEIPESVPPGRRLDRPRRLQGFEPGRRPRNLPEPEGLHRLHRRRREADLA